MVVLCINEVFIERSNFLSLVNITYKLKKKKPVQLNEFLLLWSSSTIQIVNFFPQELLKTKNDWNN